jgi:hypothetical protein
MIDRSKKITGRFYSTASARRPVREWLLSITKEDRRIVGRDIQKVEFGWPIGMPYCRPLGRGLWEERSARRTHRTGYFLHRGRRNDFAALL